MINRFKKHNDTLFLALLLSLLSVESWVLTHYMTDKIMLLEQEVVKIDKQDLSFTKQNIDILHSKKQIQEHIDHYLELENALTQKDMDHVKNLLIQNIKSKDLLSILPPSEIATIEQTQSQKKIQDDVIKLKARTSMLSKSIAKMGSDNFSDNQFSIGNISDTVLKSSLSPDLNIFLNKEKELFKPVLGYHHSFYAFKESTNNLNQVYPLFKIQKTNTKNLLMSHIEKKQQQLQTIQIISLIGIVILALYLAFVLHKKRKSHIASVVSHLQAQELEPTTTIYGQLNNHTQHNRTLYNQALSLITELNELLNKQVNLHFDVENFHTLSLEQKDKLTHIILELVRFSGVYSFDSHQNGDIVISLKKSQEGDYVLLFKDNGKGLFVEELKANIKSQYHVSDSAFLGKNEQQIYSFIFKPGFKLMPLTNEQSITHLNLDVVSKLSQDIPANISLSTQEHNGTTFMIQFRSIKQ